tara:strand:+ start:102 stop:485 length:384 start_codon:yes stop_codon:yes gene_type:complete
MTPEFPIDFEMPLPPRELQPNHRCHWRAKARAVKLYRNVACGVVLGTFIPNEPLGSLLVQATFYHASKRRRDRDNLLASLKAAFDGMTDAGLVADDSLMVHLPVKTEIDRDNPRVVIRIAEGEFSGI